jgi:hypothetical protein
MKGQRATNAWAFQVLDPLDHRSVRPPLPLIGSDPPAPARSVEIGRLPSLGLPITDQRKILVEGGDCSSPKGSLLIKSFRYFPSPFRIGLHDHLR